MVVRVGQKIGPWNRCSAAQDLGSESANGDCKGYIDFFYLIPAQIMDFFLLTPHPPLTFSYIKKLPEVPDYAVM